MHTTWILVADSSRARIFEMTDPGESIREIDDFANPEGRASGRELQSDAEGRYFGKGERNQAHTSERHPDPVQHQTDLFSKSVGHYVDKARVEHRYDHLWVIAPPKFLGSIRDNLSKDSQRLIEEEIPKDLSKLPEHEVVSYVKDLRK